MNYESNDSLYFDTKSSSENEPSQASSSEDESDKEQIETQSHKKDCQSFTVLQLQSLAMIAFLLRHNLTGVTVNYLFSPLKVFYQYQSPGSLKYEELFQVIDKVHFKVCHYCHICHKGFPPNKDLFKCETPSCPLSVVAIILCTAMLIGVPTSKVPSAFCLFVRRNSFAS